jgi:hypothetical protein
MSLGATQGTSPPPQVLSYPVSQAPLGLPNTGPWNVQGEQIPAPSIPDLRSLVDSSCTSIGILRVKIWYLGYEIRNVGSDICNSNRTYSLKVLTQTQSAGRNNPRCSNLDVLLCLIKQVTLFIQWCDHQGHSMLCIVKKRNRLAKHCKKKKKSNIARKYVGQGHDPLKTLCFGLCVGWARAARGSWLLHKGIGPLRGRASCVP